MQWLEEIVWKLVPVEPGPAFALFWFSDLRRTVFAARQHEHSDVVPAFCNHDVVRAWAESDHMDAKTGFLLGFTGGAVLYRLAKLKVPARQGPTSRSVRALALAKKNLALALNYDADANAGTGRLVLAVHAAVRCAGGLDREA